MRRLQRQAVMASLAVVCMWSLGAPAWGEQGGTILRPPGIPPVVAQAEPAPAAPAPSQGPTVLPPGGTSIEDLLLQKGSITMDE
ncbi:MAG: hypothetical protein HY348_10305, partial [Nitrospira defluvii]|nr:hypothetical protein [Nitrospira defluvii]